MNLIILCGNLTHDPELNETASGDKYCRFRLAVNRDYTTSDGTRLTDFFDCVAWKVRAELVAKYARKGTRLTVQGRMENDSYEDKNGEKRSSYSVNVAGIDFSGSKTAAASQDGTDEELPENSSETA